MISFLQERLVRQLEETARLRSIEPHFETPALIEMLLWHRRTMQSAAHMWLRERLAAFAQTI